MSSILNILTQNFRAGSRTRRPDDAVPRPEGARGALQHETALCVGCQSCAYVCSPSAITFDAERGSATVWQYFAGQCTFCGRCVEYCPTQALSFGREPAPVTGDQADHRLAHRVPFQTCTGCGKPIIPLPGAVLVRLYGDPLPADIAAARHLCEACRGRATSERLKNALAGSWHG